MRYRNARLANGFLSLDQLAGKINLVKSRTVSDRGAGVGYLVPTLMLICRNGSYRDESIREIAQRRKLPFKSAERLYFGHHEKILKAFCVQ